jgi:Protein of unknown function (DUF3572)
MRSSAAETLALKVLGFLAAQGEPLERFLAVSGVNLEDLRERVGDPQLLAAVLEFLLVDDRLVIAFAEEEGLDPKLVHEAKRALPGAAPEM